MIAVGAAGMLATVVAGGLVGPSTIRAAVRRGWLISTNRLVDVGGYWLRIDCQGSGQPTVVMDAGLGQPRQTWGHVPSQVVQVSRVCTYDRAGLGESDPAPKPRTSREIVTDLHTLLAKGGVGGPYVLVGHSFGGINMRLFASSYPDEVVGMVMVDASHEDQTYHIATSLEPETRDRYLRHEQGDNGEGVDVVASGALARAGKPIPQVPLIVLSSGQQHDEWQQKLQVDLAGQVLGGRHVLISDAGHFIQLDRPEIVASAIRAVIRESASQKLK